MKRKSLSGSLMCLFVALVLGILLAAQAQEPGRYDKDTIFSFHFDEGGGKEVTDSSGNKNHGNLGGGKVPRWVDGPEGKFGTALEFFDCNYVEIPASPELDTGEEITFETWLNLNSLTASWSTLYSKNSQSNAAGFHWIYIYDDGRLAYQYANGAQYVALTAEVDWQFGEWTHVAITHKIDEDEGGVVQWYINGQKIHEEKHTDKALPVIGGKASIGTYQSTTAPERYALDGMMDEVRLSPWVKTEAEILASMNALAVEPRRKLVDTWGSVKTAD